MRVARNWSISRWKFESSNKRLNLIRHSDPFQLQITASVREQPPLRAIWAIWVIIAATTLPTAAFREPTLLCVIEKGFRRVHIEFRRYVLENVSKTICYFNIFFSFCFLVLFVLKFFRSTLF